MSDILTSTDVAFAIAAVREAAVLVRRVQHEMVGEALSKDDKSPVTVADFAAQAIVTRRLHERFPGATLIGEENASALRSAESGETLSQIEQIVQTVAPEATADEVCQWIDRGAGEPPAVYWTLDPVDGTKGFLRHDQYAVALALIEDGEVTIGVLGCPELEGGVTPAKGGEGSIIAAVRGEGCWTQPLSGAVDHWTRLRVAPTSDVRQARLLRSVEKSHTDVGGIDGLIQTLGITADAVPMDSQAKYAVLAAGGGDVLLRLLSPSRPDYREKVWDQAAGSIVVEEAGGRVTDLDGKRLDFSHGRTLAVNRGVIATNGKLHDSFLAALSKT